MFHVAVKMNAKGVSINDERCITKFAALKKRYQGLKEANGEERRRVQWPFFHQMDKLFGNAHASNPEVTGVGASTRPSSGPSSPPPPPKRRKPRGKSRSEELERLAELDERRMNMDEKWYELTKASHDSTMQKNTAVANAANALALALSKLGQKTGSNEDGRLELAI